MRLEESRQERVQLWQDLRHEYRTTFASLADSVSSMFTRFEDSFEGWVDLLLSQLPRVLGLLAQVPDARAAVQFAGGTPSLFGALFGGARAAGGDALAGRAYLVGEYGPELFVPTQSGTVIPNGGIGGDIIVNMPVVDVGQDVRNQF